MTAKRIVILLVFFQLFAVSAYARGNKTSLKANYYFNHYAYHEAIPYFEELVSSSNDLESLEKLAECYRLTGNDEKAAAIYNRTTTTDTCTTELYVKYAHVLMRLGRYETAVLELKSCIDKNGNDNRITKLINACEQAAERSANEFPAGITIFQPFNSNGADFAPTVWNGNVVFTSDTVVGVKKGSDKWTGNKYFSIYKVSSDGAPSSTIDKVPGPKDMYIKHHIGPCTFAKGGKEMYYTRSRYDAGFLKEKAKGGADSSVYLEIMIAGDFDSSAQKFTSIKPFRHNSTTYSVAHPAVSPDGKRLIFSSDKPGGYGGRDLYLCNNDYGSLWSVPTLIDSTINTGGDEVFPWWADDSTLYFSSDGHNGLGGLDIYRVQLNRAENEWTNRENMPQPLNSSYDDLSLALPANSGSGYFSSDRPSKMAGDNIFFYRRMKLYMKVIVVDSATGKPLDAHITSSSVKTGSDQIVPAGTAFVERLWPDAEYFVSVSRKYYKPLSLSFVATSAVGTGETDTIFKKIALAAIDNSWDSTFAITITETEGGTRPGIMDSPAISSFEVNKVYVIGYFDFNFSKFYYKAGKADINVEKRVVLDTLANILKRNPTMSIQVRAHTDCRGTSEYNMKLSVERAASVVEYLLKKGIASGRLEYKGFGETDPIIPCPDCQACTEEQHAQNRVLEFKVLKI
jgi:hypothetical protein